MKKFAIQDIKMIIVPLGILAGLIILIIFSVNLIFNQISSLNQKLSDNNKSQIMLRAKLNSLQTITPTVSTDSQSSLIALPATSSVLSEVSQLQSKSRSLSLVLSNAF